MVDGFAENEGGEVVESDNRVGVWRGDGQIAWKCSDLLSLSGATCDWNCGLYV